ncbi:MAG: hypothetical protein WDZ79_02575 [Candidatus Paceibacterota bacterium]
MIFLKQNWFKLFILISVVIVLIFVFLANKDDSASYEKVVSLTERLGDEYVKLHEVVGVNERIGRYEGSVASPWYQKNEGWLLRNQTIYCSNRLIDDIEAISEESGIYKYTINPDGRRRFASIDAFKEHLVSLDELCVSEGEFREEAVLEPTLFITPEHSVWRRVSGKDFGTR